MAAPPTASRQAPAGAGFYTIGHSTRSLDEFVALLAEAGVKRLLDIRTVPRSRRNPQFNLDTLPAALAAHGIAYEHVAALGGLRGRSKTVAPEVNGFWENDSFHHYADYALTPEFAAALDQVVAQGRHERCALMCAEAVWWRCHRRIVADHLLARGERVLHILGPGHVEPAQLTAGAQVQGMHARPVVTYPGGAPAAT
ncbi:MAG: DUF488 domain-containing protein [Burkholderiales bacterium]|nr:DUF488 domain-containing protein [Burkholderiales bacterium]